MKPRGRSLALAATLAAGAAGAQVRVTAEPVFGRRCAPWAQPAELVVRVENARARPLFGTVSVERDDAPRDRLRTVRAAAVSAPAHGVATVRVVPDAPLGAGVWTARVVDPQGRALAEERLSVPAGPRVVLLDATPGHRLATSRELALGTMPLDDPGLGADARGDGDAPVCGVALDPDSGAPLLPQTVAGYAHVGVALMTTDALIGLPTLERDALLGHVARGGSLALVPARRDDLSSPPIQALFGRDLTGATRTATGQGAAMAWMRSSGNLDRLPGFALRAAWWTYQGARVEQLSPTLGDAQSLALSEPLGARVAYGEGRVLLLGWNPASVAALDDPWSSRAVAQMLRTSAGRLPTRAPPDTLPVPAAVRAWLTPRAPLAPLVPWIALALVAHALALGPGVRALASRRPSRRTLALVPLLAASLAAADARALRVARERLAVSRALTVLEAPAGFSVAASRSYRGLTSPTRAAWSVTARDPRHDLVADVAAGRGRVWRVQGRAEATLRGLVTAPWTTLVVREEGVDALAGAVSITSRDEGPLRVTSRLRVALRDAVLVDPRRGEAAWFPRLMPGVTRSLDDGVRLPDAALDALATVTPVQLPVWGTPEAERLLAWREGATTDLAALARATGDDDGAARWRAVLEGAATPDRPTPWRMLREPMLIARVERPTPARRDGLRVDVEETWICVHGEGGEP